MEGPSSWTTSAALEQAVDDGLGEVWVVKDVAPSLERLARPCADYSVGSVGR
jgi:hypothetical protein